MSRVRSVERLACGSARYWWSPIFQPLMSVMRPPSGCPARDGGARGGRPGLLANAGLGPDRRRRRAGGVAIALLEEDVLGHLGERADRGHDAEGGVDQPGLGLGWHRAALAAAAAADAVAPPR